MSDLEKEEINGDVVRTPPTKSLQKCSSCSMNTFRPKEQGSTFQVLSRSGFHRMNRTAATGHGTRSTAWLDNKAAFNNAMGTCDKIFVFVPQLSKVRMTGEA